jgi:hypothetical protein
MRPHHIVGAFRIGHCSLSFLGGARGCPLTEVRIAKVIHAIPDVPASAADRYSGVVHEVFNGGR